MGQTARTTKLVLHLSEREQGGANRHKRRYLEETVKILDAARHFYLAEFQTVATSEHPTPLPDWNFSQAFPDFPNRYRRSVIKDCIGKARGYLTTLQKWQQSGKKKGKPGVPTAANHPTLYAGTFSLDLDELDLRKSFVRRKRLYWRAVGMGSLPDPLQSLL